MQMLAYCNEDTIPPCHCITRIDLQYVPGFVSRYFTMTPPYSGSTGRPNVRIRSSTMPTMSPMPPCHSGVNHGCVSVEEQGHSFQQSSATVLPTFDTAGWGKASSIVVIASSQTNTPTLRCSNLIGECHASGKRYIKPRRLKLIAPPMGAAMVRIIVARPNCVHVSQHVICEYWPAMHLAGANPNTAC
eukprot:363801-Chlamydomonas_euryale.AAC.17